MTDLDVKTKPDNIWNVDETSIALEHSPPKVIASRHYRPAVIAAGRGPNTTMFGCGSAKGKTIPPYIVFKGARVTAEMREGLTPGTVLKPSGNGWSNALIFNDWFNDHFKKHVTIRPILMFYDGHTTHYSAQTIQDAREDNIHMYCLPPNTSHRLQPLDATVFSPFKRTLMNAFHDWLRCHPFKVVTLQVLPGIICDTYMRSMYNDTIKAGFRKCGIYPLDREEMDTVLPTTPKAKVVKNKVNKRPSRKERVQNRTISYLLEGELQPFEAVCPPKKAPRQKLIPDCGLLVTTEEFLTTKRQQEAKRPPPFVPAFTRKELHPQPQPSTSAEVNFKVLHLLITYFYV